MPWNMADEPDMPILARYDDTIRCNLLFMHQVALLKFYATDLTIFSMQVPFWFAFLTCLMILHKYCSCTVGLCELCSYVNVT